MTGNQLAAALRSGRPVFGTLLTSPSPHWPKAIATLPLDFIFIDTEHIPLNREQLAWMCVTYRALGYAPLVRIPSPSPYEATIALDGGACGIIAPYVETAEQVRQLAGAVKHRPLKGSRLEQILTGAATPDATLRDYIRTGCSENVLIVNIESAPAMEALEDIVKIDELDAVLIGPHDLSTSLGIPEQYERAEFDAAVRLILRKARAAGKGAGIHYWHSLEQEKAWLAAGANLIVHSADLLMFIAGMKADLEVLRRAAGVNEPAVQSRAINI